MRGGWWYGCVRKLCVMVHTFFCKQCPLELRACACVCACVRACVTKFQGERKKEIKLCARALARARARLVGAREVAVRARSMGLRARVVWLLCVASHPPLFMTPLPSQSHSPPKALAYGKGIRQGEEQGRQGGLLSGLLCHKKIPPEGGGDT
jgi:hypothetical protein